MQNQSSQSPKRMQKRAIHEKSPGQILRETRQSHDLTLENVSQVLNIRKGLLNAIEEGNYEELPASVYTIGFIKSYADFLRLDGEHLVMLFKRQTGAVPKEIVMDMPESVSMTNLPTKGIILGALGILFLLIMIVVLWSSFDEETKVQAQDTMPLEQALTPEEIEAARQKNPEIFKDEIVEFDVSEVQRQVTKLPASKPETQPLKPNSLIATQEMATTYGVDDNTRIVLKAQSNSWLEIKDASGKILLSRVLKEGDSYNVPDEGKSYLTTGNAGGLGIYVDGDYKGILGQKGEVLKGYRITTEGLIKD